MNRYGICAAYNLGANKSKFDVLCFSHEDILFHTNEWGVKVSDILSREAIGIIGNAGAIYKTKSPSGSWSYPEKYNFQRKNVYQHYNDHSILNVRNPSNESLSQVVTLDGMWLCMRKQVWSEYMFDEQTFNGFHFYDMDICFQVTQKYKIYVTYNVLIEHLSSGTVNRDWIDSSIIFCNKWNLKLPASIIEVSKSLQNNIEMEVSYELIKLMIRERYNRLSIVKYFVIFIFQPPLLSADKIKYILKLMLFASGLRNEK